MTGVQTCALPIFSLLRFASSVLVLKLLLLAGFVMSASCEAHYFDALSISSLGSDGMQEQSIVGSTQTVELYQRLQDLDDMTSKFLLERRVSLHPDHDSFSDVELSCSQEFELKI